MGTEENAEMLWQTRLTTGDYHEPRCKGRYHNKNIKMFSSREITISNAVCSSHRCLKCIN